MPLHHPYTHIMNVSRMHTAGSWLQPNGGSSPLYLQPCHLRVQERRVGLPAIEDIFPAILLGNLILGIVVPLRTAKVIVALMQHTPSH